MPPVTEKLYYKQTNKQTKIKQIIKLLNEELLICSFCLICTFLNSYETKVNDLLISNYLQYEVLILMSLLTSTVSTTLTVLPPPTVHCKQMTVSGKHLAVLKGMSMSLSRSLLKDLSGIQPEYFSLNYLHLH